MYAGISIYVDTFINKVNIEEIEDIEVVEDETPTKHDVVNFMLVGADNLDSNREASYTEERSDVFKIVSLDYTDKVVKLTSLDRDIVVWIPDKGESGEFGRFNWAYSFGQAKYALNCINYNLDLDVEKYVAFSFAGFINVIDTIGGVDIRLSAEEAKAISGNGLTFIEGTNHLDGKAALSFSRIRSIDNDFNRMKRQNDVIQSVISKLKDLSPTELLDVVNACLPYVSTNLNNSEIKQYIIDILSFDLANIKKHSYPTNEEKDVCVNKDPLGGYLLYSYSQEVIELHKFIYSTDDYVPTKRIYDNEKLTYKTFGNFYTDSELLP